MNTFTRIMSILAGGIAASLMVAAALPKWVATVPGCEAVIGMGLLGAAVTHIMIGWEATDNQ